MLEAYGKGNTSFIEKGKTLECYFNSPKHYTKTFLNEPSSVLPQSPDILSQKACVEMDLIASFIKPAHSEVKPAKETSEIRLDRRVDLAVVTPDEAIEKLLENPSLRSSELERLQPEGKEKPASNVESLGSEPKPSDDNLDGVLSSISHDLDFLLNRTPEIEAESSSAVTRAGFKRVTKPPTINIILEESEEESPKLPEHLTDVLRTSC